MGNADPYVVLGISPGATPEEIRAAFRRAVRQRHPDTSASPTDDTAVRNVIDAYRLLIDAGRRAHHNTFHPPQHTPEPGAHRIRVQDTATASRAFPPNVTACSACQGTGVVRSVAKCPACHGRAEITDLETTPARILRCQTCRGAGRIRSRHPCEACDGTGAAATAT